MANRIVRKKCFYGNSYTRHTQGQRSFFGLTAHQMLEDFALPGETLAPPFIVPPPPLKLQRWQIQLRLEQHVQAAMKLNYRQPEYASHVILARMYDSALRTR